MTTTVHAPRTIRAPRGTEISCRGWQQEAVLRMLMNNLDPEVAERPEQPSVYGGGRQGGRGEGNGGVLRRDRRHAEAVEERRDAARAVRKTRGRVPHT